MNIKDIMNKLDTYIRGYSELLQENNELKERFDMYDLTIEASTNSVQRAIEKVEKVTEQLETYKKDVDIVFNGIDKILELMIEKESISLEELEQLKLGIKKLKDNLNEPTD